jgi:hypothetical protein
MRGIKARNLALQDLEPGSMVSYRGPLKWGVRPTYAMAQVIGVDTDRGVVFLATLFRSKMEDQLEVEIGFLPVTFSVFQQAAREVFPGQSPGTDRFELIQLWRQRREEGTADAFGIPIWEAERDAWETVTSTDATASRENFYIEYAFPKRDDSGHARTIEVAGRRRRVG